MSERSLHSLSHLLSNLRSDDGDKGTEEATDVAVKMREEYNAAMCVCRNTSHYAVYCCSLMRNLHSLFQL